MRSCVQVSTRGGLSTSSRTAGVTTSGIDSSVQLPSIPFPPYTVVGTTAITRCVSPLWQRAKHNLDVVANRGDIATPISYHLRKVSERALRRGEARTKQPVEILGQVAR